jgi:hypothetical protein
MRLSLNARKPCLVKTNALCTFRTSKNYLWSLVRDRLDQLQQEAKAPLLILDAACHALITRQMFPHDCRYHGLDIARERLKDSRSRRLAGDTLYWADLTKPLPLQRCFDVVVSCNTLSHLPAKQQALATGNLINACRSGADLLINTSIDQGLMPLAKSLIQNFQRVEPIYFDSFLSHAEEEKNLINTGNVAKQTLINEQNLPNDACFHQQVLFHAHGCLHQGKNQEPPQDFQDEFMKLNAIPEIQRRIFSSDAELLNDQALWPSQAIALLSPGLYSHELAQPLRQKLESLDVHMFRLDVNLELAMKEPHVVILGLEEEWCLNLAEDRLAVNRVREIAAKVTFALVQQRAGRPCKPSLVAQDL